AAFLTRGQASQVFEHLIGAHSMVVGEYVLEEFTRHCHDYFGLPGWDVAEAVQLVRGLARVIPDVPDPPWISQDPDDDHVISAALRGEATVLLSADPDILSLGTIDGLRMIRPDDFWRLERGKL
ncbi:MAG: hypothetical protein KC561_20240, partial [Myxococcales bacterium]|nr:hypothetical protein [Myxococcales bacterium]